MTHITETITHEINLTDILDGISLDIDYNAFSEDAMRNNVE